jgi:hypothetical protein
MKGLGRLTTLSVSIALSTGISAQDANDPLPDLEELWRVVQAQQAEIKRLQEALESSQTRTRNVEIQMLETTENLEAIGEVIDQPAARGSASWADRTQIGGYGEMLYNNETGSSSSKEIDVQRFVIFLSHEFNENLRFFSELEIEHGLIEGDAPGAVELEQAYLGWDYADKHRVLAGMYLAPLGILNETHEPNTFYGVERNLVESRLIPSTYRVNGVKFAGQLGGGFSYDLGIHEGLFFASGDGGDLTIRSSRQDGARAELDSPAYTGRIRYTGVPGLELGLALQYQSDMTQDGSTRSNIGRSGLIDSFGNQVTDISGLLTEAHLVFNSGPWGLRALYAQWNIDNRIEDVVNGSFINNGLGRDLQTGYYIEPSYQFNRNLGAFARFEHTDERAGSNRGAAADSEMRRSLVGLNYWLTEDTVLKFDYQFENDAIDRDLDGFNLGIGWQF